VTKRHFNKIAEALRAMRPMPDSNKWSDWVETCQRLALVCADANPNFNHQRFLNACGCNADS
jgi:hypothetical protein